MVEQLPRKFYSKKAAGCGFESRPRLLVSQMIKAVLGYLVNGDKILLGLKKRGFGEGKLNGFGGKLEANESFEQAILREAKEELGIIPEKYFEIADLIFYDHLQPAFFVKAFVVQKWHGIPKESDELLPRWFDIEELPFNLMWEDDKYWLPLALSGKKLRASFWYKDLFGINPKILRHEVEICNIP